MNTGETSEFDPSSTLTLPPFTAAFTNYVRNELSFKSDMYYYVSGGTQPWDYGVQTDPATPLPCSAMPPRKTHT